MRRTYKRGIMTARVMLGGTERRQSNAMKLRRECGCSGVRSRGTGLRRLSGQAVDGDDRGARDESSA